MAFQARYSRRGNLAPLDRRGFVLPRDGAGPLAKFCDLGFFAGRLAYAPFKTVVDGR
jgi:hypothetical protein